MTEFKVLFIPDVVGEAGREVAINFIVKNQNKYDFIIADLENAAGGYGVTKKIAEEFFIIGVDVITLGNHAFDKKEIYEIINDERILRPINYPEGVVGRGFNIYEKKGVRILVVVALGRTFLSELENPFIAIRKLLEEQKGKFDISILEIHAETTSEKNAARELFSGSIDAIIGTHTHVQTADGGIYNGSFYITDLGMCGSLNGIIGF
ncbi:MAG: YmdB family metallophosphoesterase, partial [bacterium]|nr:YmdB family metallophosphoesterase [bacterium]